MKTGHLRWLGFGLLTGLLAALGFFMIPAHWCSIWMDTEFTDWISPIANRLHDHARLYEDGLHLPVPPLAYVIMHLVHPHNASWIDESFLNFIFQAASLLLLYLVLSKGMGPRIAFAAVISAVPLFFSLEKTIFYDSLTQFLVVACAAACIRILRRNESAFLFQSPAEWLELAFQGFLLSLIMLAKQNTGAGVVLGVCGALLFLPQSISMPRRCLNILVVMFSATAFFCLLALAMSPWVSFPGLMADAFVSGSEPKGGSARILQRLISTSGYLAVAVVLAGMFTLALARRAYPENPWREKLRAAESVLTVQGGDEDAPGGAVLRSLVCSFAIAVGSLLVLYLMHEGWAGPFAGLPYRMTHVLHIPKLILNAGLGLGICGALFSLLNQKNDVSQKRADPQLAALVFVFLPAAIFHALSVNSFRWTYDNNPLMVAAIVCVIGPPLRRFFAGNGVRSPRGTWGSFTLALLCMILFWTRADDQFGAIMNCTESWPEIKHLAGARLRPESEGMRKLVATVRSRANPAETVLVLPEDPNIETWIDRGRPALSCAIIFTDQYWDRYVEKDFQILKDHPPGVIIIGPRNEWRKFSRFWNVNRGAERLMDLVISQLLPGRYSLESQQTITFQSKPEFMDVYVRRDN